MNTKDLDIIIDDVTWSYKECGADVPQNILDTLNEIKYVYSILDEYNVTPQNIRAVLLIGQMLRNQPTFKQCIHEWGAKGFKFIFNETFKNYISITNFHSINNESDELEFDIDTKDKTLSMSGEHVSFPYDLIHLLSQTLKALEDKND